MFNKKNISLVIPCFNEEEGLINIFKKMPNIVDEVIVIDNNSYDNTAVVAKQYRARVICIEERGYGISYHKGLASAGGDIIITIDGDDSYPIGAIKEMIIFMEQGNYDFVSGCRFPLQRRDAMPFINKLANIIISYLIRLCFKVDIKDSQSGMWVFKKSLLRKIISSNKSMGFSQEIKLNAWLNPSIRCAEFHIYYTKRKGKVKFKKYKDSLKNLYDMLIFLNKSKNRIYLDAPL